jgi:hypothetical protein
MTRQIASSQDDRGRRTSVRKWFDDRRVDVSTLVTFAGRWAIETDGRSPLEGPSAPETSGGRSASATQTLPSAPSEANVALGDLLVAEGQQGRGDSRDRGSLGRALTFTSDTASLAAWLLWAQLGRGRGPCGRVGTPGRGARSIDRSDSPGASRTRRVCAAGGSRNLDRVVGAGDAVADHCHAQHHVAKAEHGDPEPQHRRELNGDHDEGQQPADQRRVPAP